MSVLESFLAYATKNLPMDQIQQESGGKQTDKNGQTLVGKHRDGSMPKPSERAYGVSQIQVGTARETAQKHGIPWDEKRLMNDRDYNLQLGDLHQGDLNEYYKGDKVKAKAAYHSGRGNVDRAIRAHGANWAQGLGPEGRAYIGAGGSGAGGAGNMDFDIPDVLGETGRTTGSGPTRPQIVNPNDAAPLLREDFKREDERARTADNVLSQTVEALGAIQDRETLQLQDRNERVDGILDEQASRVQATMERVAPLFQQKRAIVEQEQKLTNMNPLLRGVKSLFDQNYDREHLREVSAGIDSELKLNVDEYSTMTNLQDGLLKIVEKSHEGLSMTNALDSQHLASRLDLASKSLVAANLMTGVHLQALTADSGLRAQQMQLTDQVLSELTPGQVSTYLEAAKKSPNGTVMVNGANLSEGQLLQSAQRSAQQQVQLSQLKINMKSQEMALVDKSQNDVIGSMTTSQIRAAIQNKGVYNGVTLPLDKLGQGLQASMGRDATMAQGSMLDGSVESFKYMARSIGTQSQIAGMRAVQMTGGQPTELLAVMNRQNPQFQAMMDKIKAAPEDQRQILAQQYAPQLAKMGEERMAAIDTMANRWAGSNKALIPLAKAFMSGGPLNSEDSARGLISMVRTGQNFGGQMSAEARAALDAAKRVVQAEDAQMQKAGASVDSMFGQNKMNAKQREQDLIGKVSAAIGQAYAGSQFNSTLRDAPKVAKQIGHLGQNLDPAILRQAMDAGDNEGYRRMGTQLGLTPDQAKQMFNEGEQSPLWAKVQGKAEGASFNALAGRLGIQQSIATTQYLDQQHPKIGKYKAGAVYANLLADPRFADNVGKAAQAQMQQGFGDYLVGSAGSSSLTSQVSQYGQIALTGYNQLLTNQTMSGVNAASKYNSDPMRRTAVILGAIPELPKAEEQLLLRALAPIAQGNQKRPGAGEFVAGVEIPQAPNEGTFDLIRTAITSHKFQDPRIEAIRKKAAAHFDTYSRVTDEAFDRFGNYDPEN